MSKKEAKVFSLSQLDANKASETAFEFEYMLGGEPTGVFLSVLGGHEASVLKERNKRVTEIIAKNAARETQQKIGVGKKQKIEVEVDQFDDTVDDNAKTAASRIVSWRGIVEPCTPENALKLCRSNEDLTGQVIAASSELANFIKL